jgi:hypothetical protein
VGQTLAGIGLGPSIHDGLACVHCSPNCEVQIGMLAIQLLDGLEDPQPRADRPLSVVAVGDRRAEHCHDGVPDDLLYEPAE